MPSFQLVVRRGPKSGETFELKAQTVIIGRDSTADIIINDPEVSRNHCRLILDRSYHLQDLGSTNGTFVDGQRLGGEPLRLSNGQILQLGSNVTLLYQETEMGDEIVSTVMVDADEDLSAYVPPPKPQFQEPLGSPVESAPPQPYMPAEQPEPQANVPDSSDDQPNLLPGYSQEDEYLPFELDQPKPGTPPPSYSPEPNHYGAQSDVGPGSSYAQSDAAYPNSGSVSSRDDVGQPYGQPAPLNPANSAGGNENSGGGAFWSTWTRQQSIIAVSVLAVVVLAGCCLVALLGAIIANPDLLNFG